MPLIAAKGRRSQPSRGVAKPTAIGKKVVPPVPPPWPSVRTKGLNIEQFKWTDFGSNNKANALQSDALSFTPTTRTPAPISILPPELLEEIFLTIIWTAFHEPTGYFKPLTLVCREWCVVARRLELVVLNVSGGGVLMDKAIGRVQSLRSREDCASTQALIIHGPYKQREFHRLDDLVQLFGPTIRSLHVYGYWPNLYGGMTVKRDTKALEPLQAGFAHVEELALKTMPSADLNLVIGLCNLQSLQHIDLFTNHITPTSLQWLTSVKLPLLRTLRVGDITSALQENTRARHGTTGFFASMPSLVTLQASIGRHFINDFTVAFQTEAPSTLQNLELWLCGYSITDHPDGSELAEVLGGRAWSSCAIWMWTNGGSRLITRKGRSDAPVVGQQLKDLTV